MVTKLILYNVSIRYEDIITDEIKIKKSVMAKICLYLEILTVIIAVKLIKYLKILSKIEPFHEFEFFFYSKNKIRVLLSINMPMT